MLRKWSVAQLNKESAMAISQNYGLPVLNSMLLDIRNIKSESEISDFMSDEITLENPFVIKDMDKAVDRIHRAIDENERICVYGDFDADGVTSTALLYSYLYDMGADVIFYIPSREEEGYGLNNDAISSLKEENVSLIITVDNGIAAIDEVDFANSLGIDVVITDHHMVPPILPEAVAIIDLHRDDCESKFKELSGVGVALKLVMALEGDELDPEMIFDNYADLAAIGTIGDIVPLVGENRIIVKHGLKYINNSDRAGVNALISEAGYSEKTISTGIVSFSLVPRINAGGRLGLSKKSVEMLLSEDEDYAQNIAFDLGQDNSSRQKIEREILSDIDKMIMRDPSIIQNKIIVIYGENWHQGVIGIVASRLKETYGKPAIVITKENDVCRGSGRSVKGFSICDAVTLCSDMLLQFGGHPMAVGFSIEKDNIPKFIKAINSLDMCSDISSPSLELDCKLNPAQLSVSLVESLSDLEPFGAGNPTPLFGLYKMQIKEIKEISQGKHLKFSLSRNGSIISALKFNTTIDECPFEVGDEVDLAVSIDINEYNGLRQLSIIIKDYKFSNLDIDKELLSKALFEKFCRGEMLTKEEAESLLPVREDFAAVYRFLIKSKGFDHSVDVLLYRINNDISYGKLRVILEAMSELGLIEIYEGMKSSKIVLCNVENKVSLDDSVIIKKLKEVVLGG